MVAGSQQCPSEKGLRPRAPEESSGGRQDSCPPTCSPGLKAPGDKAKHRLPSKCACAHTQAQTHAHGDTNTHADTCAHRHAHTHTGTRPKQSGPGTGTGAGAPSRADTPEERSPSRLWLPTSRPTTAAAATGRGCPSQKGAEHAARTKAVPGTARGSSQARAREPAVCQGDKRSLPPPGEPAQHMAPPEKLRALAVERGGRRGCGEEGRAVPAPAPVPAPAGSQRSGTY